MTEEKFQEMRRTLIERLEGYREIQDEEIYYRIDSLIQEAGAEYYIRLSDRNTLRRELFNSIRRLDVLQELIDDDSVTEIMVNGTEGIFVERAGQLFEWGKKFASQEKLEDISKEGFGGVLCIETGGPTPGLGCAGRGIIATFQFLEDLKLFETWKPDVVLYDVLGDVVCGGFAAPIREGYAEKVLIVTSGEKMALYAANNISSAVRNFEDRSYARIFGIVLNHRNVENETEKVNVFAEKNNIPIVGEIPRSDEIIRWEDQGKTVIEGDENSEISEKFFALARKLLESEETEKEDI